MWLRHLNCQFLTVLHWTKCLTSLSVTSVILICWFSLGASSARPSASSCPLLPEWPFIHLMSNEQVSLTFTINSITNSTAVLLIFEDFSTNSTDFECIWLHCLLTFVGLIPASWELPLQHTIPLHKGRSSPMALSQSGTICCLQRLQSHIQHSDYFLPHLYIVLVRPPLPRTPTRSRSFPVGVGSPTLPCLLWIYLSIFDGQRPFHVLIGFHR